MLAAACLLKTACIDCAAKFAKEHGRLFAWNTALHLNVTRCEPAIQSFQTQIYHAPCHDCWSGQPGIGWTLAFGQA